MAHARPRPPVFLGWVVVGAATAATFAAVAFFNPVLGVFMPVLGDEFGWGRTLISGAMTTGTIFGAVASPVVGSLIDRYGGRRLVVGGTLVMTVCLGLLALVETIWQFYILFAIGRAIVSSIMTMAATVTVSKWFVRQRGIAVGVTTMGSRVGFAFMPIAVQLIISAWGWREAWLALGGVVLVCALPIFKYLHGRPEDFGLQPDGEPTPSVVTGGRMPHYAAEVSWTRDEALASRTFWLVTLAVGLQVWAGGAINLHQIPHMIDRGLSPESAALTVTVFAAMAAIGTILEGLLDEKVGTRWTFIVGLLGSAGGMLILINVHGVATAMAFAVGNGLSFGLMVTSNQIFFAYYFGREALGAIRGRATVIQLMLNAVGPLIAGAAYDITGSYLAAFIPFTIAYVVAAAGLFAARRPPRPAPVASTGHVG